jgi:hypothetical protein
MRQRKAIGSYRRQSCYEIEHSDNRNKMQQNQRRCSMKAKHRKWRNISLVAAVASFLAAGACADEATPAKAEAGVEESGATELAKMTQNPIASLISVPFQNNFNFDQGPRHVTQWNLNVQPVIPISLNEDWNLITRTIVPIINQPSTASGLSSAFGLGDINPSLFFSPAKPSKLIWGVGPTWTMPTATDKILGAGKWDAGPTVVALTMQGPWVIGVLANNQWSFAGWGDHSVNAMLVQPFINYNLDKGWYLTSAPIMTANWNAKDSDVWTVPLGCGVGRVFKVGKQPLNVSLAAYDNVHTPVNGPQWQLRFQIQFLFPK